MKRPPPNSTLFPNPALLRSPRNPRAPGPGGPRLSSSQVKLIETIQQKAAPEVVAAVRSGDISLSTAAVVASLPVDEQQAVAAAGADELKQAAKRVRDAKKKPKAAKPEAEAADGEGDRKSVV